LNLHKEALADLKEQQSLLTVQKMGIKVMEIVAQKLLKVAETLKIVVDIEVRDNLFNFFQRRLDFESSLRYFFKVLTSIACY
jgi:hypothetical protein